MRIVLDVDRCIGSANCEMIAPDVFEVRDDMVCHILVEEPGPDLEEDAELGVEACPTRALRIE
ncbi:MAG: ferredoxin [Acidimicrobiaceae bacterium]|nr:ferredoxin [Acidimicrobiaceae bacterium]